MAKTRKKTKPSSYVTDRVAELSNEHGWDADAVVAMVAKMPAKKKPKT